MPEVIPTPDEEAIPFNEPENVTLSGGQKGTITFSPVQGSAAFHLPILAVSKFGSTTYEVWTDSEQRYGQASIPPTDVDDLGVTFLPALGFERELKVIIRNTGGTQHTYYIQPVGWEEI